ncbi:MAG: hypothetical protein K2Y37_07270 [Pirellulales bacterium]|nr:hypothetical protein [Pirellulales bacterium]
MPRPDRHFDWHRVLPDVADDGAVIDPRARLSLWPVAVGLMLLLVWARMAWLERRDGTAYRELATRPIERVEVLLAPRGRILTRDGTVLAQDEHRLALAVSYRWLEEPPNEGWLRLQARSRLGLAERRDAGRVAREIARLRDERAALHASLAALCGLSAQQWRAATWRVQSRVAAIHGEVNAARRRAYEINAAASVSPNTKPRSAQPASLAQHIRRLLFPPDDRRPPAEIAVAEELEHHVVFEGLTLEAAAAIESRSAAYPGARVVQLPHRRYPQGSLAANLIGHLGVASAGSSTAEINSASAPRGGVMGIERQLESRLRGRAGADVEVVDRSGHRLASFRRAEPVRGRDVMLSINASLQASCEQLIERALARRTTTAGLKATRGGGAIVVLEARSGAILAAASVPTFSPEGFTHGVRASIEQVLADPGRPLVDRTCRMALPPGGIFKVMSTLALLDSGKVQSHTVLACQGYWRQPNELRCAVYRRHGRGHGEVDLTQALACGCNVYFFEHAARVGAGPLVDWTERFGFGQPSGVDLPDESAGHVPDAGEATPVDSDRSRTTAQLLAIGQGALTATPLQVARAMAAIANGGQLVTPYVVSTLGVAEAPLGDREAGEPIRVDFDSEFPELIARAPRAIEGLDQLHLQTLREALQYAVDDPDGAANAVLAGSTTSIAGLSGTAQAGSGLGDHAWFAGYAPAEAPRIVVVVALEHAGEGTVAAAPVARLVFERLVELGFLKADAT